MIATNYRLSSRYHFINSRFEGSTYNSSLLPIIPDIWERLIQQISKKVLNVSNVAYKLCRIGHIRFSSSYFLHESKGKKTIKYIVVLWNGALMIIFAYLNNCANTSPTLSLVSYPPMVHQLTEHNYFFCNNLAKTRAHYVKHLTPFFQTNLIAPICVIFQKLKLKNPTCLLVSCRDI